MDIQTFVITPLAGAVIGYFTNWLAIKMLFRPHKQINLWGYPLPFTPGLIPKERYRLAAKVGDTVGEHLLTDQVLTEAFVNSDLERSLNALFEEQLEKLRTSNTTLRELANQNNKEQLPQICREFLVRQAEGLLSDDRHWDALGDWMMEKLLAYSQSVQVKEVLDTTLKSYLLKLLSSEKKLWELIPENTVGSIRETLLSKLPLAAQLIEELPQKHPSIDDSLRQLVGKTIDEGFGHLMGIFMNKDKIYHNIKKGLVDYLQDEENRRLLNEKMSEFLDGFLDKDVKTLVSETRLDAEKLAEGIASNFQEELTLLQALERGFPQLTPKLEAFIKEQCLGYVRKEFLKALPDWAIRGEEKILSIPFSALFGKLDAEKVEKGKALFQKGMEYLLEKGAVYVVEGINVKKLVEDRINDFEIEEGERIILSVVQKELNAITIVGGVLGLVIGFFPAVMKLIGG